MSRGHLQRVPPNDADIERHLLGAAMLRAEAARVVAGLDPAVFYKPTHGHIAAAIAELVAGGNDTDPGTVAAVLRRDGWLDAVGGPGLLNDLVAECPNTTGAAKWADLLTHYAHRRRTLALAQDVVDNTYKGIDTTGLVAELHTAAQAVDRARPSTWDPVDLTEILTGDHVDIYPAHLHRTDGQALLYPGKVHAVNAEPEAGKSWLALLACQQAMTAGGHVLYIDYEAGPVDIVTRLLELGADPKQILDRFHYLRPDSPIDAAAAVRVTAIAETWPLAVAVIDGVAEALALNGWDENKAADVTAFFVRLPRRLADTGAAVIVIDHLVKDKENQGRYARGSTAKLAAIDGATYKLEIIRPFARGANGAAKILVTKDRHGWVRQHAPGGRHVGELHLNSDPDGHTITLEVRAPDTHDPHAPWRPTIVMEKVSRELETLPDATSNGLASVIGGQKKVVLKALQVLVEEGYVAREKAGRGYAHRHLKPYRKATDPLFEHPDTPPPDWHERT